MKLLLKISMVIIVVFSICADDVYAARRSSSPAAVRPTRKRVVKKRVVKKRAFPSITARIDQPVSRDFPDMKMYVSVADRNNEPILSLVRGNFKVFVDGQEVSSKLDIAGFQYTEEGITYALVVSSNGIMEGEPLEQQLKAAVVLLESLRDQDYMSLYTYAEEVKPIFEFQKKNEELLNDISKIELLGSNPHLHDVLVYVSRRLDEAKTDRKVIIVITDGRETGSRYTEKQMFEIIDEKNIPVYGIGLKLMAGQNLFRIANISKHSGGAYVYAGNLSSVSRWMKTLTRQAQLGYVLNFEVDNIEADNQLHQLQVNVSHQGVSSSFFKNFVAVKVPLSFWIMLIMAIAVVILIVAFVIMFIIYRRNKRKEMGITRRKCPVCKQLMKDDWDECLFCKYKPIEKRSVLELLTSKFKKDK